MSIKEMREKTGLSQSKFAKILDIPTINISRWEQGVSKPPKYVEKLIEKNLKAHRFIMEVNYARQRFTRT